MTRCYPRLTCWILFPAEVNATATMIRFTRRWDDRISAKSLPVLNRRTLTGEQVSTAEDICKESRNLELKPAYLADADPNRALLDRRVVCDLIGFDEETYAAVRRLAAKWCAEPSVHGVKARPRDAKFDS